MELSAENFFNQFQQLNDLAGEIPTSASQVDKEKVGSLLLSAVPLEGLGINAIAQSAAGQAGIAALKTIGQNIAGRVSSAIQGGTNDATTSASQAENLVPAGTDETISGATELPNVLDFGAQAAAPVTETVDSLAATVGASVGAEAGGDIAAITAGTLLDTIPVIGPLLGLATTLGIGLKDLLDKGPKAPPIYSSFQMGL